MSTIISIENLSKRYWLRHQSRPAYHSLREDLMGWLRASAKRFSGRDSERMALARPLEEFWALEGLSFKVQEGDVVGIIGRNGAGKSTLLKVLSRITEPTEGRVEICGRVASLLEVGTGFHPELTGRENIYLNGAILGMTRAEVRRKFDEIVAFAEVEKFLDTPVKRFSSGMYVRLAFAVAAHLEPEILIVDEVLAVGDAQFQQKCLGKMQDVSMKQGRTVLFVSHQMGTVRQLCTKGLLLAGGRLEKIGGMEEVIEAYISSHMAGGGAGFIAGGASASRDISIEEAYTLNELREVTSYYVHDEPLIIQLLCRIRRWVPNAELRIIVDDARGRRVFTADVHLVPPVREEAGALRLEARIPKNFLRPGTYSVTLAVFVHNQVVIELIQNAFSFVVQDGGSKYAASEGLDYGCVFSPVEWTIGQASEQRSAG